MGKGEETKTLILEKAVQIASIQGLEGLTIGSLADELGMSKSGLFGKFSSKENLQIEVLRRASELFRRSVIYPTLKSKPGLTRLKTAFLRWLTWANQGGLPGGCLFLSSSAEFDDRPGIVRNHLQKIQRSWKDSLSEFVEESKRTGELHSKTKADSLVQDIWGIILAFHFFHRLLEDKTAENHAKQSFSELLKRNSM
ncbi:TetR/AcrR family transcriptional regulator [Leptospira sp. 96542]|nr:TetR/AcrR family transcriptional regulator [Leptospira sp. 96542]